MKIRIFRTSNPEDVECIGLSASDLGDYLLELIEKYREPVIVYVPKINCFEPEKEGAELGIQIFDEPFWKSRGVMK
ncbi:MAG: hypothetical protein ACE5G7_05685 [Candidatus Hydrothermarchaeaceae archaeon]